MNTTKLKSYVGLAQRANAVLYGEDAIEEKQRLAKVVLLSSCASEKYRERVKNKIKTCPLFEVDCLQECLHRDNVLAVAITNVNLANEIIALLR